MLIWRAITKYCAIFSLLIKKLEKLPSLTVSKLITKPLPNPTEFMIPYEKVHLTLLT